MLLQTSAWFRKAGLSGLFLLGLTIFAGAEPLTLVVQEASAENHPQWREPIINMKVAAESQHALAEYTQHNVGKQMGVRIDGQSVVKPIIRDPIMSGSFQISGNFTLDQANALARRIESGAKVEVEIVEMSR